MQTPFIWAATLESINGIMTRVIELVEIQM